MSKLTHHQGHEWKFNHKNKGSRYNIPSNRFTIIMDQGNYNDYYNHQKYSDNKEYYKKPPEPELTYCDSPPEHHQCIARCGELVINGDFENRPDPFWGWVIKSGVEEIDPDIGELAHQGLNAARMGFPDPHAILYQDVPGICPGIYYQLNFYLSAATEFGNAPISVRLEFLDHRKYSLERPAIRLLIPGDSLSSVAFTGFNNSTRVPAPPETRFARLSFEIDTHNHTDRYVHLDDVSLIAIWNPREGREDF